MLTVEQKEYIRAIVKYRKNKFEGKHFQFCYFNEEEKYWFENCQHKVTANEINSYIKQILKGKKDLEE